MISPTQLFLYSFGSGFLFVVLFMSLVLKDFLGAFLSTRFGKGKRLLAIHSKDGINVFWKVGFLKDGAWFYKHAKKDSRIFTISDGCVKRFAGVNWLNLPEAATCPFNFKFVKEEVVKGEVPIKNKDGKFVSKDGKLVTEVKDFVRNVFFEAYDDSKAVVSMFDAALTKKPSRASLSMGGIDFKRLLLIAAVVIGGYFIIKSFVLPAVSGGTVVIP